ncbi:hypothetical protein BANRA_05455 [Klebsiella pneumoniae]|nr:hypothetical protein BANRA_05455 [Klebsiella pneumoniae]
MTTLFKKYGPAVVMGVLSIALPLVTCWCNRYAIDRTDVEHMDSVVLRSWLVALCGCFVIPASFIPRIIVISLIGIGSASFLVS